MSRIKRNFFALVVVGIILGVVIVLTGLQPRHKLKQPVQAASPSVSPAAASPTEDLATACHGTDLNLQVKESTTSTTKVARYNLIFTNISSRTCTLTGAPTATLLDSSGHQLGQPATTSTDQEATTVALVQGGEASASLTLPTPLAASGCSAAASRLEVMRPGGKHTLFATFIRPFCPGFAIGPISLNEDS